VDAAAHEAEMIYGVFPSYEECDGRGDSGREERFRVRGI